MKKMTYLLAAGALCVLLSGCTCGKASAPAQCEVAPAKDAPAKVAPAKDAPAAAAVPMDRPAH